MRHLEGLERQVGDSVRLHCCSVVTLPQGLTLGRLSRVLVSWEPAAGAVL